MSSAALSAPCPALVASVPAFLALSASHVEVSPVEAAESVVVALAGAAAVERAVAERGFVRVAHLHVLALSDGRFVAR